MKHCHKRTKTAVGEHNIAGSHCGSGVADSS